MPLVFVDYTTQIWDVCVCVWIWRSTSNARR